MQALAATHARAITEDVLHCGVPALETWAARWLDGTDVSEASAWAAAVQWAMGWAPTPTEYNRQLDDILAALGAE